MLAFCVVSPSACIDSHKASVVCCQLQKGAAIEVKQFFGSLFGMMLLVAAYVRNIGRPPRCV